MKHIIIIFLIFLSVVTKGTDYTVGSDGDYTSITALNADKATFSAGDNISFKRGETFYGTIETGASGSSGNTITYGAYGTGADPIITGFTTITGWTQENDTVWYKTITYDAQATMVTVDGVNTGMGRYPDYGTRLGYDTYNALISITDYDLPSTPDWTGADVAIWRKNYALRVDEVDDHTGNVITYNGSGWPVYDPADYFFQDDIRTLTVLGEWYHDTGTDKFYMYFGTGVDPDDYEVKVATKSYLIDISNSYIAIYGLNLIGSISNAINGSSSSTYLSVNNTSISFAGQNGIYAHGTYSVIDSCTIIECHSNGVSSYGIDHVTIKNNTIRKIGLILGGSSDYLQGVFIPYSEYAVIEYNTIDSCGYNGASAWGLNDTIRYNFINNSCLRLNDGAGIYTQGDNPGSFIDHNIVLNTIGLIGGPSANIMADGIYMDEEADGNTVTNNTLAYNGYDGIKFHKAHDNIVEYNKSFGNVNCAMLMLNSEIANILDNIVRYNQLVTIAGGRVLRVNDSKSARPNTTLGTLDYNIYARPTDDYDVVSYYVTSSEYYVMDISEWTTWGGYDTNSDGSPITVASDDDTRLIYNASKESVTYDVTGNSVTDIDGTVYSSTITIASFESVIILGTDVDLVILDERDYEILGNDTIYGLTASPTTRRALPLTFTEDGAIQSITMYHNGGSGDFILAVYSDSGGFPSSRLGITAEAAINSTAGWQTLALTDSVDVDSAQTIWLAWVYETIPGIRYIAGTPGRAVSTESWSGGMPSVFGTSTVDDYIYSIYCNYTTVPPIPPTPTSRKLYIYKNATTGKYYPYGYYK